MPAALCPAGEFPATTTLPRYAAGREDMVAVLLLFCGQAGQFLELTTTNRSSTRLLQDYFGWHGMLVDEANYRISAVHGCASILSSDCRPPKSPPR